MKYKKVKVYTYAIFYYTTRKSTGRNGFGNIIAECPEKINQNNILDATNAFIKEIKKSYDEDTNVIIINYIYVGKRKAYKYMEA